MQDQDFTPSVEIKNEPDLKRTRRNVLAMAGIAAGAILASGVAAEKAQAGPAGGGFGPPSGPPGGFGGPGGGGGGGPACFLSGTKIRTENGEISVENLRAGDKLPTLAGQVLAIKEVKSWTVTKTGKDWSPESAPIKICRSAIAPNYPQKDLFLSPLHAIYVDGMLVAARNLVNGKSIIRCSDYDAPTITYYHVELEDHQVIWAEGVHVESRLANWMTPCAPLWSGGRRFELASRFRSAISPWIDRRNVYDKVRDRLEVRSETALAA